MGDSRYWKDSPYRQIIPWTAISGVIPVLCASERDRVGIGSTGEHQGHGLVHRSNASPIGIPTTDFEWPPRIRPPGPAHRSARGQLCSGEFRYDEFGCGEFSQAV